MRIKENSFLPLAALEGALVINEHGAEFRIHGFQVALCDVTDVIVLLKEYDEGGELLGDTIGMSFASLDRWTIQLQGETS